MTPRGKTYKKEYAVELLRIAQGDLGSARVLLKGTEGRPENVCFLVQQVIEKAIKAVQCHLGLTIVHTHDVEALIAMLPEEERPPQPDQLAIFTEYATIRRYEEGFAILTKPDLESMVRVGESVTHWAKSRISK